MLGKKCWAALYDDKTGECDFCPKTKLLDEDGNPTKAYGWDYERPFDGAWFRVMSAAFPWVDGRMVHVVTSVDITETKKNEEIIRQMAEYDVLTRLPNRRRLTNDCDAKLPFLKRENKKGYMIFFDLDGFKAINDELGHDVGDALLAGVGDYLQSHYLIRENCYRYGGDEFVVLCAPESFDVLEEVIAYIQAGFLQDWQLNGAGVRCGVSMGISCFPEDTLLTSELLRTSDQAMYHAKKSGKGCVHMYNQGEIIPWEQYSAQNRPK